jgi:hypothetical protein
MPHFWAGPAHLDSSDHGGITVLCPVMKAMNPGEVAFREQLGLGFQPVLDMLPV